MTSGSPVPTHGTLAHYRSGCRCQKCKAANARYKAKYYLDQKAGAARLVPAGPTLKLLDELESEGFSKAKLARKVGLRGPRLRLSKKRVTKATKDKVEAFYELVMAGA